MDRFEGKTFNVNPLWLTDLHSSMDRFEEKQQILFANTFINLHSSMDRFEGNVPLSVLYAPFGFTFQYG